MRNDKRAAIASGQLSAGFRPMQDIDNAVVVDETHLISIITPVGLRYLIKFIVSSVVEPIYSIPI